MTWTASSSDSLRIFFTVLSLPQLSSVRSKGRSWSDIRSRWNRHCSELSKSAAVDTKISELSKSAARRYQNFQKWPWHSFTNFTVRSRSFGVRSRSFHGFSRCKIAVEIAKTSLDLSTKGEFCKSWKSWLNQLHQALSQICTSPIGCTRGVSGQAASGCIPRMSNRSICFGNLWAQLSVPWGHDPLATWAKIFAASQISKDS